MFLASGDALAGEKAEGLVEKIVADRGHVAHRQPVTGVLDGAAGSSDDAAPMVRAVANVAISRKADPASVG